MLCWIELYWIELNCIEQMNCSGYQMNCIHSYSECYQMNYIHSYSEYFQCERAGRPLWNVQYSIAQCAGHSTLKQYFMCHLVSTRLDSSRLSSAPMRCVRSITFDMRGICTRCVTAALTLHLSERLSFSVCRSQSLFASRRVVFRDALLTNTRAPADAQSAERSLNPLPLKLLAHSEIYEMSILPEDTSESRTDADAEELFTRANGCSATRRAHRTRISSFRCS